MEHVKGIFDIPVVLHGNSHVYKTQILKDLTAAQHRLKAFAQKHGWDRHIEPRFAARAEIFDSQSRFIKALLAHTCSEPSIKLPAAVSAALENDVFMSVSPEVYSEIFPEGIEACAFEKLITHEMAHRLHIRVLNGDEDAMGPVWFFEGFAVYAADQFENEAILPEQVWDVVNARQRGCYRKYAAVMRFFLGKTSLVDLVCRAGDAHFKSWLRSL